MDICGRFIGLLIVATAALAFSFFGHVFLFDQWRMQHERQLQRSKVLEEVLRLQRLVMDVETNFRGYLLTEQQSYLEPINLAESRLEAGLAKLTELTASAHGLQAAAGVLSNRLTEFVESKKALVEAVGTDKQDQVRLYVRGGNGRALFLTMEKAIGDFEMRIQRELPLEAMTYESWMQSARWQLLILESLGFLLCVYLTKAVDTSKKKCLEQKARLLL